MRQFSTKSLCSNLMWSLISAWSLVPTPSSRSTWLLHRTPPGEGIENSFTRQGECEQMSSSPCFLSSLRMLLPWAESVVQVIWISDWLIKSLIGSPGAHQRQQSCLIWNTCWNTKLRNKVYFLYSFFYRRLGEEECRAGRRNLPRDLERRIINLCRHLDRRVMGQNYSGMLANAPVSYTLYWEDVFWSL